MIINLNILINISIITFVFLHLPNVMIHSVFTAAQYQVWQVYELIFVNDQAIQDR